LEFLVLEVLLFEIRIPLQVVKVKRFIKLEIGNNTPQQAKMGVLYGVG
jgi:hypothetical protein